MTTKRDQIATTATPAHIPDCGWWSLADPVSTALLKAQAQSFGCTCESRSSSEGLEQTIKTLKPDVVILAQNISGENSMLHWQQLKVKAMKLPPAVLMVMDYSATAKMHAKDVGIDEILAIPIP